MTQGWRPLDPQAVTELIVQRIDATPAPGPALRVAVDGPDCAAPAELAETLVMPLRRHGRDVVVIPASTFWRDASLRLEYGREDVTAYRSWVDARALRREVLDPLGPGGSGAFLPALRDPDTNRSSRVDRRQATPGTVVVVAGEFLLDDYAPGQALPFDLAVHLALSPAARSRRTPPDRQWTLDALRDYDQDRQPAERADLVVKLDDPRHPAVLERTG